MKPRRKRRISTEGSNLAEYLQERILGEIFRFGRVVGHAQTDGINTCLVRMKQSRKRIGIAVLGAVNNVGIQRNCARTCRVAVHRNAPFKSQVQFMADEIELRRDHIERLESNAKIGYRVQPVGVSRWCCTSGGGGLADRFFFYYCLLI